MTGPARRVGQVGSHLSGPGSGASRSARIQREAVEPCRPVYNQTELPGDCSPRSEAGNGLFPQVSGFPYEFHLYYDI